MGNLFGKQDDACSRWQEWLDAGAQGDAPPQSLPDLTARLSANDKSHLGVCQDCRLAMDAWLVARQSMQNLARLSEPAPPWLAARVMAAIAQREEDLRPAAAWIAVPRFAARLAWAAAALLFVASTWLYQKPLPTPAAAPPTSASEGLFDTQPPQVSQDEVLVSTAERDHE
jgi:hypothetical protein